MPEQKLKGVTGWEAIASDAPTNIPVGKVEKIEINLNDLAKLITYAKSQGWI